MNNSKFFLPLPGHSCAPFIEALVNVTKSLIPYLESLSSVDNSIVNSIFRFNSEWHSALFYSLADKYKVDLSELLEDFQDVPYVVVCRNGHQRFAYIDSGLVATPKYRYFQSLFNRIAVL